jgi:hypothetical protein
MGLWACECGLLNERADAFCLQCGGSKDETWTLEDRRRHYVLRVLDVRTDSVTDEERRVPRGMHLRERFAKVATFHKLKPGE